MRSPSDQTASWPRFALFAPVMIHSTMPRMPPFREMMPTMPAIMNVNSIMVAWSKSATALATYTSKLANRPVKIPLPLKPSNAQAPNQSPSISAGNTLRMSSAIPMATSGGSTETQAGMVGTSACCTRWPSSSSSTRTLGEAVTITSLNRHISASGVAVYASPSTLRTGGLASCAIECGEAVTLRS